MDIKVGKRYKWSVTIPCDGRIKSGLLVRVEGDMAILMTKDGQEWLVYVGDLKPNK